MHFRDIIGGRLVDILKAAGAEEVRRVGERVQLRRDADYTCWISVLDIVQQRRVAKLCRKHGVDAVRFGELLGRCSVAGRYDEVGGPPSLT